MRVPAQPHPSAAWVCRTRLVGHVGHGADRAVAELAVQLTRDARMPEAGDFLRMGRQVWTGRLCGNRVCSKRGKGVSELVRVFCKVLSPQRVGVAAR